MLFRIFDNEFEADMLDYDYAIMLENEVENVVKHTENINKKANSGEMAYSVLIKESTDVIRHFFDSVFGDGAADKIFGDRIHFGKALEAYAEFILQKNNHSADDINAISNRYLPLIRGSQATAKMNNDGKVQQFNVNGNRAQRRNSQKKKNNNNPNKYNK